MSDGISLRCSNREALKLVFGNTDIRETANPYQLQWMSHWAQAGSSSSFESHNHFALTNVTRDRMDAHCSVPVETMTPTYMFQSAEAPGGDNGRFGIINNSVVRNNLNSLGSKTIEKQSSYHFQKSESLGSELTHFPMFGINRKIESIMAPMKRAGFNTSAEKMNELLLPLNEFMPAPHLIEFASEGHQHQQEAQIQHDEENDGSGSGQAFKEHFRNANLDYPKHKVFNYSQNSTFMVSKMKISWIKLKDGPGSCPGNVERGNVCSRNRTSFRSSRPNRMSNRSTNANLYCKDQNVEGSTTSALFEKLALPSVSLDRDHRHQNLGTPVSLSDNDMGGVDTVDTQFIKKDSFSLVESDAMDLDISGTPNHPEDGSSLKSHKDVVHPNLKISEIEDTETSSAENLELVLLKNPSNAPTENTQRDSEASCKWLKRLQANPLESIPLSTKRFKTRDASSSGKMQNLLARVVNYNRSIISDLPPCKQHDKKNDDSEKITPWIRRWCRDSNNKEKVSPTPVLCEPENSKMLPEKFEARQFPSLAAMALMGKQVTNFHPCEFRKRGSAIVWKI